MKLKYDMTAYSENEYVEVQAYSGTRVTKRVDKTELMEGRMYLRQTLYDMMLDRLFPDLRTHLSRLKNAAHESGNMAILAIVHDLADTLKRPD